MQNISINLTEDEVRILETILYLSLIDTRVHLDNDAKTLVKYVLNKIVTQKGSSNEKKR